jgi:hypothetical protein
MKARERLNFLLHYLGYSIEPYNQVGGLFFGLHQYRDKSGNFDYEQYRSVQIEGNVRKITNVFAKEENIRFLSNYIVSAIGQPRFGVCHGTRRGMEQIWFRKYLNCEVFGTEISHTAAQFPDTIQWDFHQIKNEWIDKFDFIYSNALDHSYDPRACLRAWMSCVRPGGLCIIEHTFLHESLRRNELDPFGVRLEWMPYLITQWGEGRFGVRRILNAPDRGDYPCIHEIVIQRFEKDDST